MLLNYCEGCVGDPMRIMIASANMMFLARPEELGILRDYPA
jgi:hypothetical protein